MLIYGSFDRNMTDWKCIVGRHHHARSCSEYRCFERFCSMRCHLWRNWSGNNHFREHSSGHHYLSCYLLRHHSEPCDLGRFCGGVRSPNTPKSDSHHGKRFTQGNQFREGGLKGVGLGMPAACGDTSGASLTLDTRLSEYLGVTDRTWQDSGWSAVTWRNSGWPTVMWRSSHMHIFLVYISCIQILFISAQLGISVLHISKLTNVINVAEWLNVKIFHLIFRIVCGLYGTCYIWKYENYDTKSITFKKKIIVFSEQFLL